MNKYSEDQVLLVRLITSSCFNDYYSILGVDKSRCSVEDIRKAYKKMCLRVHPDKNKAPGAGEAFKKVDDAYRKLLQQQQQHTSSSNSYSKPERQREPEPRQHTSYSNSYSKPERQPETEPKPRCDDMEFYTVIMVGAVLCLVHEILWLPAFFSGRARH